MYACTQLWQRRCYIHRSSKTLSSHKDDVYSQSLMVPGGVLKLNYSFTNLPSPVDDIDFYDVLL